MRFNESLYIRRVIIQKRIKLFLLNIDFAVSTSESQDGGESLEARTSLLTS
jgi:hypothetical protein